MCESYRLYGDFSCRFICAAVGGSITSNVLVEKCLEKSTDWNDWKFSVDIKVSLKDAEDNEISEKIKAEINLLHAVVIKRDINKVKFITNLAVCKGLNIEDLLKSEIKCEIPDSKKLIQRCSWILDASVIHLATWWHLESLAWCLEACPDLCNIKGSTSKLTPIHVAAINEDGMVAISVLIQKGNILRSLGPIL